MYNTETAELVGEWDNGKYTNDFAYCSEDLYLKKTGEFFLHGVGNHLTKYNCREIIQPLSHVEAQEWAEEHLTGDEYEKIFGEISDDELSDFAHIQRQLEQIDLTVESLKLWVANTIAEGKIDKDKLEALHT